MNKCRLTASLAGWLRHELEIKGIALGGAIPTGVGNGANVEK